MMERQRQLIESAQGKPGAKRTTEEVFALTWRDRPEEFEAYAERKRKDAEMSNIERVNRNLDSTSRFLASVRRGDPAHGSPDERGSGEPTAF